jgi:hypothetical protein
MVRLFLLDNKRTPLTMYCRAQFAKRDTVYYQSNAVKTHDAFVIICNINSSPSPPVQPPVFPRQTVPKGLLDTVGALLDDPLYSDVEFIIPRRGQNMNFARRIWASRRLLKRAEYFETSEYGSYICMLQYILTPQS